YCYCYPRHLHSFPTRRSSDLKADGKVDYDAAGKLAMMLVADGSDGVVVSGTTGESPSLSDAEKIELVRTVKEAIPGKNVVAGTRSEEHTSELQSRFDLVCRLL